MDSLIYFHNEILQENNDFIISLSKRDEDIIKIWNIIDKDTGIDLVLNKTIEKKDIGKNIEYFCMFNNANYNREYNYLFIYGEYITKDLENNQEPSQNINFYILDKGFKFTKYHGSINNSSKIKFLDTFYDKMKNTLYLLSSNDDQINLIVNPLKDKNNELNGISFTTTFEHRNGNNYHNAFMAKIDNKIELFDSNIDSIKIWDIDNNENPIKIIDINNNAFIYDMCLWNSNYLLVSTNKGFQIIDIEKEKQINILDECNNKNYTKVRKICTFKYYFSIVGIDNNNQLCLWSKKQ